MKSIYSRMFVEIRGVKFLCDMHFLFTFARKYINN